MTGSASEQLAEEARASFEAGDYEAARQAALTALGEQPLDAALLRLAGRSAMELGLDDAVEHLQQAVALDEGDADTWRYLGDALAYEGRVADAGEALRRAVLLRPEDTSFLVDVGHALLASGQPAQAIASLAQAVEREPGNVGALRGLVEAYRREGRLEEAFDAASAVAAAQPDDVTAALDVAELSLELGRDDAAAAFGRLRDLEDDPEHEVFAYHGMIEAELRRDQPRRALDIAVEATRVDRLGRTTDVLAYIVAQVFGASGRTAPERGDVDQALAESRAAHRRLHLEAVVL
jgi:tetratricopeptide (TPR) repeat protein